MRFLSQFLVPLSFNNEPTIIIHCFVVFRKSMKVQMTAKNIATTSCVKENHRMTETLHFIERHHSKIVAIIKKVQWTRLCIHEHYYNTNWNLGTCSGPLGRMFDSVRMKALIKAETVTIYSERCSLL